MIKKFFIFALAFNLVGCSFAKPTTPKDDEQIVPNPPQPTPDDDYLANVDVSHINPDNRLICFTFDDGPNSETSLKLLEVFENYNKNNPENIAHGTFFYKGTNVKEGNKDIIQKAIDMKFQIGNHTLNHVHLENLPKDKILDEVNGTVENLSKLGFNFEDMLVRLPFGTYNDLVLETIDAPMINWTKNPTLDVQDWNGTSTNDIINLVINNAQDGGIVLMHEGYTSTINAVKQLLPMLQEMGYQVVSINEYLKVRNVHLENHTVYDYFYDLQ